MSLGVRLVFFGNLKVPFPLGSPRALTGGVEGEVGRTDTRNPAGDCGLDAKGDMVSEQVGLDVTGGGGGGGGGKSCAGPQGEETVLELRKGGGGGGNEGEPGDSKLPPLGGAWKGGRETRPNGLCEAEGESGEAKLELEEVEDCVEKLSGPAAGLIGLWAAINCLGRA